MESYKNFDSQYIGTSDVAGLILVGLVQDEGLVSKILKFGIDASYQAYIVDETAEISSHYHKVAEFQTWMRIYDDCEMVRKFTAEKITVYRAAEMGCIIQLIKKRES